MAKDPVIRHLEQHVDELVDHLLRRSTPASYQRAWAPRIDVYETAAEFTAVVELAGVDPSSVTIEIEASDITIHGQRGSTMPPADGSQCLQLEIPFGRFERRLVLPAPVVADQARASFEDGMLVVHLPKLKQRGPTRVQVDIGEGVDRDVEP